MDENDIFDVISEKIGNRRNKMAHDTVPYVGCEYDKSGRKVRDQAQPQKDTVTISKKFLKELLKDQRQLRALKAAGVDNWVGFEEAQELLEDWDM